MISKKIAANKVDNILKLVKQFQDILLKKRNTYLLGDLNFDMVDKNYMLHNILKWNNHNQNINKAKKSDCKTVDGIPKTKSSLIDVLITNNPKSIKKSIQQV